VGRQDYVTLEVLASWGSSLTQPSCDNHVFRAQMGWLGVNQRCEWACIVSIVASERFGHGAKQLGGLPVRETPGGGYASPKMHGIIIICLAWVMGQV